MPARRMLVLIVIISILVTCVCCETGLKGPETITVMSYNLQSLFDSVDQGGEYEDFTLSRGVWNEGLYRQRISSLASAILAAVPGGPEVLVVQEVENSRVLADLAEALGGYIHQALSPSEESTLACGLVSRLPLLAVRAHRYRSSGEGPSSVPRYLLECEVDTGGPVLFILVAHWKSKLGGAEATEPERQAAAMLASLLIRERLRIDPMAALILAGDLNENPDEYALIGAAYPTALMPASAGAGPWLRISPLRDETCSDGPVLYSPWDDYGGYSYLYGGEKERIDHLLFSPGLVGDGSLKLVSFSAEAPDFLVGSNGRPYAWDSRLGAGYSDHLPIRATLRLAP